MYAYVASKFANDLIVIDMDTLEIAGKVLLATPEDSQGVLPLPIADHGWIEETAKLVGSGKLTAEVEGWLKALTKEQKGS